MAIGKPSRALSTLSPVPDNLKTPEAMLTSTEQKRMTEIRAEAKKGLTQEVTRLLKNDRLVLNDVRKKTKEELSTQGLEPDALENKLVDAALKKLAQRRELGQDVGSRFPAFKDHVPPVVYGKHARSDDKKRLIEMQLDMSGGRARVQRDEESDDEELNPYLKKEGPEDESTPTSDNSALTGTTRETSSTKRHPAAQRYSEIPSASPKRRSTRTTTPRHSSDTQSNENYEYESDSENEDSASSSETEDDDLNIPLIAVIRGQPIPKDIPTFIPSRAIVRRRKHRITKDPSNTLKAVSRGEIVKKYDPADVEWVWVEKKGMVPRKRVRETGAEVETREQENKEKNKKAKV
jgi:hypothetical protein